MHKIPKPAALALLTFVAIAALLASPAGGPAYSAPTSAGRYFAATGYSVGGVFLRFFDGHGGVRIFGYPISGEILQNGRKVQYFERQRFELHPDLAGSPFEVLLGHLGSETALGKVSLTPIKPGLAPASSAFVPETGHSLGVPFRSFWQANGGVPVLGYPISEPVIINGLLTQYFERARLEYHPNKAALGYGVELGHLGREYVAARPDVAALIAAGPKPNAPPLTSEDSYPLSPRESRLLELVNKGRTSAGLAPLTFDSGLTQFAIWRSTDMASRNYFSHVTPEGKDFVDLIREQNISFKYTGEILARSNHHDDVAADRAYIGWLNSPPHNAIIMNPRFNRVGVGEANDGKGYRYFTMVFVQR
jgi:uncharacterized protein YkwD